MSSETIALAERAQSVFGDRQLAMRWLSTPNGLCRGTSPIIAIETAEGRYQVERQLAWFAGNRPPMAHRNSGAPQRIEDLISDPLIQIVLDRAGSGPEELLHLCRQVESRQAA